MQSINLSLEYNNVFILLSFINIISIFVMNYNYVSLFVYLNSLSLNYIMFKNFYFEIKNKYSNINFLLMPNYYPSNRNINKFFWYTNIMFIFSGLSFICIKFWMNEYEGMNITSYEYFASLIIIGILSILNGLVSFLVLSYSCSNLLVILFDNTKQIISNYINKKSLLYFPENEDNNYYCWICDKNLSKLKTLKKLNCPCQEYFHPDCIDKYLGLYNNYCKAGHKIAKYEHTV